MHKSPVRILFLDVDGVLNSEDYYKDKPDIDLWGDPLDPACIDRVKQIVDATGALIVLTSSWRGGWEKDPEACYSQGKILHTVFAAQGLSIYDKTGIARFGRAQEIKNWLKHSSLSVSQYVILDDNDFHWRRYGLHRHVVQTDFEHGGLKEEHVIKAIQILQRKRLFH